MPIPPTSTLSETEFDHPCPIRDVLDRIGDRWSLLALEALSLRTLRFNELGREIGDISRQTLSRTLKRLECDGYISRTLYAQVPPRVEYALTELGRSFLGPMGDLVRWANLHHAAICQARRQAKGGAALSVGHFAADDSDESKAGA